MITKLDLIPLFGAPETSTFLGLEACSNFEEIDASSAFIGAPGTTPHGSVGACCHNAPQTKITCRWEGPAGDLACGPGFKS